MERKPFRLNEPIREIDPQDILKNFSNNKLDSLGISLKTLNAENHDDKFVWVHEANEKILGVMSFLDFGTYFQIDILAKNHLEPELCDAVKPGYSLFKVLEDESVRLGYDTIRVDSASERVEYWKKYGYEIIGMPQNCEGWGEVFPMEKKL